MSEFLFLLLLTSLSSYAQLGVGTAAPEESAVMDIVSSNRGLLIPRVGLKDLSNKRINGTDSPESLESALIYNNGSATSGVTEKGFYYWAGSQWLRFLTRTIDYLLAKTYTSSQVTTENLGNDNMLPLGGTFIVKASGVFGSEKTLDVELPKITADHHGLKYTIVSHKTSLQRKINVRVLPSDGSSDRIDGGSIPTSVITPRLLILQAEYVAGGTSRWHVIDVTPFETVNGLDNTFGGSDRDRARSIIQTRDGGYLLGASTRSQGAGSTDFWLIKTDAYGNKQWEKTFGGTGFDFLESVTQTSDGGYVLGGYIMSKGAGLGDMIVVKYDLNGNEQWHKLFGGSADDGCRSVIQTRDGGYALGGYTASKGGGSNDFWMVKTDKDGNKEWDKTFGGTANEVCNSIVQTRDGGYALAGSSSHNRERFWLIKTDKDGNKSWDNTYGGSGHEECLSMIQTSDGGYALIGTTASRGAGGNDFWLVKTDASGNRTWDKTFGGSASDQCRSVVQTSDGGYALGGYTASKGAGGSDFWLIKTDARGNKQWDKTFGGSADDECRSVIQTSDGGYAMVGRTLSKGAGDADVWIVTYKP